MFSWVLWLTVLLGIAACASTPSTDTAASSASPTSAPSVTAGSVPGAPASDPVAAQDDYRIGPGDLLKLEVFGVPDLGRSVRVNASGQISLPLIGAIQASGLTGEQLATDIAARLAKDYLQNPQVTIFIEEFTSQRVTVVGAVKNPGVYPLKGRTTLLQVVAAAGDPTTVAKQGSVRVLRNESDGSRKLLEYDLEAIRDGNLPDPEVLGEDVVQVETSAVKATAKQVMEFVMPFWIFAP